MIHVAAFFIGIAITYAAGFGLDGHGSSNNREGVSPSFISTNKNITVGPGDRAVLKCRVKNLGTKTVTWRRAEELHPLTIGLFTFVSDTRISVDYYQRSNEWSLIIQDVKPTDEGRYQCSISTKENEQNAYEIRLNVKNLPLPANVPAVQVTGQDYVEKGESVHLICNATGKPDPPHDVEWYKDGNKINSDAQSGILITKKIETKVLISVLVIKKSKLDDAGNYVCRSSNRDAGKLEVHILNVAAPNVKRDFMKYRSTSGGTSQQLASSSSAAAHSSGRMTTHLLLSLSLVCLTTWTPCART